MKNVLRLSRAKHLGGYPAGNNDSALFTSFAIMQSLEGSGYYVMHVCGDGQIADTWHASMDDALEQAEWEFSIRSDEWPAFNESLES